MQLQCGQSIGRYHILEQVGQGGMAFVYRAFDTQLEREVAIKIIRIGAFPPDVLDRVLKRFEREAKALARLNHPNIVKVHDYGEYEDAPYLVMDFLHGQNLKQQEKPLPWQEAMRLVIPIAEALGYAHSSGILHRDVKPSNIILSNTGIPVLTDFGISKLLDSPEEQTLTGTGVGVGTPEYMAPEQGLGKGMDGRADLYSLGIVLYELITGRKPYQADTPLAVLYKQMNDPLPPPRKYVPELPEAVERVLFKALAKNPDDRYQDMNAFAAALEKIAERADPKELPTAKAEQTPPCAALSGARSLPQIPAIRKPAVEAETYDELLPSYEFPMSPTGPIFPKKKKRIPAWLLLIPLLLLVGIGGMLLKKGAVTTPVPTPEDKLILVQATQQAFILPPAQMTANSSTVDPRSMDYDHALSLIAAEKWEAAAGAFNALGDYQDAPAKFAEATVNAFLEKREYAKMTEFVRSLADQAMQSTLKQQVYQALYAGEEKLFRIRGCNGRYGFVNLFNEQVIEPHFDNAGDFSEGLARVEQGGKYGFVNTAGEAVVELRFDDAGDFSEGLAMVKQDGKYGFINTTGVVTVEPRFDWVGDFSEGLARVKQDGKWGFINTVGEMVIEPRYDLAEDFSEGLAAVWQDGKWGFINTARKVVIEPQFDRAWDFSEGLAQVKRDGKWGFANAAGEMVIGTQFDFTYSFSEGLAWVKQDGNEYYIDPTGATVLTGCKQE